MVSEPNAEVGGVIAYIHQHLDEPLSLARLAKYAGYSPYHFSRVFKENTGLTPLYYVSSLRLQKAKDLLLKTSLGVRDIALEVGQQSLGTFTTRFTERVGMTPAHFRNSLEHADSLICALKNLHHWPSPLVKHQHARISGIVKTEVPFEGIILIGLFAKPIPEGLPLYGTLLSSLGTFCFTDVRPGIYYLMATSVSWEMRAAEFMLPHETLRARLREPVIVTPNSIVPHLDVTLRAPRLDDPPILISLHLLMNRFLRRALQNSNRKEIIT